MPPCPADCTAISGASDELGLSACSNATRSATGSIRRSTPLQPVGSAHRGRGASPASARRASCSRAARWPSCAASLGSRPPATSPSQGSRGGWSASSSSVRSRATPATYGDHPGGRGRRRPARDRRGLACGEPQLGEAQVVRTMHALRWVAADLSADRPLLITVDDAHWADPFRPLPGCRAAAGGPPSLSSSRRDRRRGQRTARRADRLTPWSRGSCPNPLGRGHGMLPPPLARCPPRRGRGGPARPSGNPFLRRRPALRTRRRGTPSRPRLASTRRRARPGDRLARPAYPPVPADPAPRRAAAASWADSDPSAIELAGLPAPAEGAQARPRRPPRRPHVLVRRCPRPDLHPPRGARSGASPALRTRPNARPSTAPLPAPCLSCGRTARADRGPAGARPGRAAFRVEPSISFREAADRALALRATPPTARDPAAPRARRKPLAMWRPRRSWPGPRAGRRTRRRPGRCRAAPR